MSVLLVNPPESEESLGRLIQSIGMVWQPDWLAHIATFLEENNIKVRIFDFQIHTFKEFKVLLEKNYFDYVCFTCHTSNFNLCLNIAERTKQTINTKIIFGGPHPSALPKEVIKEKIIDFVVIGNGETALLKIIKHKTKRKIVSDENKDVNLIPAYHLLEMKKYGKGTITSERTPSYAVFSVKKCPCKCKFCHNDKKYVEQNLDLVFQKINLLVKKYGMRDFKLMDGSFGLNKKRSIRFCKRLKKYNLTWSCQARIDNLDEELIKNMAESGCTSAGIGIESGNKEICKNIKKEYRIEKIKHVLNLLKKYGIMRRLCFMVGFPDETREEVKKTLDLAKDLDSDFVHISICTPFPGTKFYDELKKKNVKLNENYEDYNTYNLVYKHKFLDEEYLKKMIKKTYKEIYFSPKCTLRILKSMTKNPYKYFKGGINFLKFLKSS